MKLVCPSCGAIHSAESWQNDGKAREALRIVAGLPREVASRVLPYLALFRPSARGLTWSRSLRLLSELKELAEAPYVQWKQSPARANSAYVWGQAMERVVNRPPSRLPLQSHGYLRSIAYEIANDLDRAAEVESNQAERRGDHRKSQDNIGEPEQFGEILDRGWLKEQRLRGKQKTGDAKKTDQV